MKINLKKELFLEIFIILILFFPLTSEMSYLLFALLLLTILFIYRKNIKITFKSSSKLPFLIILIWFYGIIMGFINGNKVQFIFQNFAGMTLYLVFYLLYICKYEYKKLIHLIYQASKFSVYFTLCMWILKFYGPLSLIDKIPLLSNYSSGGDNILYSQELLIFIAYGINLYKILCGYQKKEYNSQMMIVIITVLDVFVCIKLSGFVLAFIMTTIMVVFSFVFTKVKLDKLNIVLLIISISLIIIILLYSYYNNGIVQSIFDMNDGGNKIRIEQIKLAVSECTLSGNGLGATFHSFIRAEEAYGMEVTYINLIHKFGIFSLILFYSYLKIIIISIKNIIKKNNIEEYLLFLIAISFIYPSLSNPFLYGAIPVVLHVSVFYVMDKIRN